MEYKISDSNFVQFLPGALKPLPEGLKPFDLTAALAGKPVVTGEGRAVTQITVFKNAGRYPLAGVLSEGAIIQRTIEGKADDYGGTSRSWQPRDLFMKAETKDVYFNVYSPSEAYGHPTEEAADLANKQSGRKRVNVGGKALKVTVEV